MKELPSIQAGYWKGERLELALRYAYRPEFIPLLMDYLGASPDISILEVGCGSGFLSRLLAKALPGVRIVGLDSDADMLDIASEMQEHEDLTERIDLGQGNAFHLPFPDNNFDLVTSHRLL